jgi:hypothetical protein
MEGREVMKTELPIHYGAEAVRLKIITIRGEKVIMDQELAALYGVEVKRLNEQVKRNRNRFPDDFVFRLTPEEVEDMRSQIATASSRRNARFSPYAFTEHGAIMAATVLNSPRAVEMSVFVVRAFVKMREEMLSTATLAKRLAEVEKDLLTHDAALRDLYQKLRPLLLPPPEPERKPIGFGVKERRAAYRRRSVRQHQEG